MSISGHKRPRAAGSRSHPPHCPNRKCRFYEPDRRWRWCRDGTFLRPGDGRCFQRFRCTHCGRRFSTRTFAADYWLRRRGHFPRIARLASEGPGLRQTARLLAISHSGVARHLARAGRHCLLFHQELIRAHKIREPLVVDGFETFEYSQFFPFHLNLAVGAQSWCLYHFTDSPLRRKGSMTAAQREKRAMIEVALGRPDPKAVERGIIELLRVVGRRWGTVPGGLRLESASTDTPGRVLFSDNHPAYRRALRNVRRDSPELQIRHRITSSVEPRTTRNPLFPANLADLLLRHGQANHRRETIAFSKRRQSAIERLAIFMVWRNAIKRRREKKPAETAAMAAGFVDRPLSWAEVFRRRMFPRHRLLPGSWWKYYWRMVKTPALGERQRSHNAKFAF